MGSRTDVLDLLSLSLVGLLVQVQAGAEFISFSEDPFDSSDSSTVLEVDYEKGSFGGSGEGGAQFYVRVPSPVVCLPVCPVS